MESQLGGLSVTIGGGASKSQLGASSPSGKADAMETRLESL